MQKIEFTFNESTDAKATAHVKDNELVKITFAFKIPRGYYYSFLNDALEAFSEQYPEYR